MTTMPLNWGHFFNASCCYLHTMTGQSNRPLISGSYAGVVSGTASTNAGYGGRIIVEPNRLPNPSLSFSYNSLNIDQNTILYRLESDIISGELRLKDGEISL